MEHVAGTDNERPSRASKPASRDASLRRSAGFVHGVAEGVDVFAVVVDVQGHADAAASRADDDSRSSARRAWTAGAESVGWRSETMWWLAPGVSRSRNGAQPCGAVAATSSRASASAWRASAGPPTPVKSSIEVVRPAAELYAIVESSNRRASDASANVVGSNRNGCSVPFQPTSGGTPSSNASSPPAGRRRRARTTTCTRCTRARRPTRRAGSRPSPLPSA